MQCKILLDDFSSYCFIIFFYQLLSFQTTLYRDSVKAIEKVSIKMPKSWVDNKYRKKLNIAYNNNF